MFSFLLAATTFSTPHSQLSRLIGTWHGTARSMSTPFSRAKTSHSTIVCGYSPGNGAFIVCDIGGDGRRQTLAIYTRDPENGKYWYGEFAPGRDPYRAALSVRADEWTYSSSFTRGGKTIDFRTVNHFKGNRETFESSYSDDRGHTWHTIARGAATRSPSRETGRAPFPRKAMLDEKPVPLPNPTIGKHLHELLVTRSFILIGGHGDSAISRDGGRTFVQIPALHGIDAMEASYVPSAHLIAVAGHYGAMLSRSDGLTWGRVLGLPTPDVHGFGVAVDNPNHFVAYVVGHGMYASNDGGRAWIPLGSMKSMEAKMPPMIMGSMRMPPEPMGDIAVTAHRVVVPMMPSGIATSEDSGTTWSLCCRNVSGMVLRTDAPAWFLSGMGRTYRSLDAGNTWTRIPQPWHIAVEFSSSDGAWYAARAFGHFAALWKSIDGKTWQPLTLAAANHQLTWGRAGTGH